MNALSLVVLQKLLTDIQFCDNRAVAIDILFHQIIQQASSLTDHLQKTSSGMEVLFVDLQMLGQVVDPFGQDRDLNLGRTGVGLVDPVGIDDSGFNLFQHFIHLRVNIRLNMRRQGEVSAHRPIQRY